MIKFIIIKKYFIDIIAFIVNKTRRDFNNNIILYNSLFNKELLYNILAIRFERVKIT